jgi:hypothetical protein
VFVKPSYDVPLNVLIALNDYCTLEAFVIHLFVERQTVVDPADLPVAVSESSGRPSSFPHSGTSLAGFLLHCGPLPSTLGFVNVVHNRNPNGFVSHPHPSGPSGYERNGLPAPLPLLRRFTQAQFG